MFVSSAHSDFGIGIVGLGPHNNNNNTSLELEQSPQSAEKKELHWN